MKILGQSAVRGITDWIRVAAIIVGTIAAYYAVGLLIVGSDKLRLNSSCDVEGALGTFEQWVLGNRFWKAQTIALDKEIQSLQALPSELTRLRQVEIDAEVKVRKDLEKLFASNPELRPSPASDAANQLRQRADAIERQQAAIEFERYRQDRLRSLLACREMAAARTK